MSKSSILFAVLITLVLTNISYGQGVWTNVFINPRPSSVFYSIKFFDSNTGIASYAVTIGSNAGGVYRTTNAGLNWYRTTDTNQTYYRPFYKMSIYGNYAIVTTSQDVIFTSSDKGANWTQRIGGYFYRNPCLVDNQTILLFNDDTCKIRKSTDFGVTFQNIVINSNKENFKKVQTLNNTIILTTKRSIYKSTNSGNNWTEMYLDTTYYFGSTEFINANNGFALLRNPHASGSYSFAETIDGGASWTARYDFGSYNDNIIMSMKFKNNLLGYVGQSSSTISATINGGYNWTVSVNEGIMDLDIIGNFGWACTYNGKIFKNSNILASLSNNTIPVNYQLFSCYPNPFNSQTTIKYSVQNKDRVCINIYEITGKKIMNLVDKNQNPGNYEINVDMYDLNSGIYFAKFNNSTIKIVLMK